MSDKRIQVFKSSSVRNGVFYSNLLQSNVFYSNLLQLDVTFLLLVVGIMGNVVCIVESVWEF